MEARCLVLRGGIDPHTSDGALSLLIVNVVRRAPVSLDAFGVRLARRNHPRRTTPKDDSNRSDIVVTKSE